VFHDTTATVTGAPGTAATLPPSPPLALPRMLLSLARRARRLPVTIGYFRGPFLMSRLRKWWVLFRNPQADIRFGPGTYLGPGFSIHAPHGGTFVTGEGVEFRRRFRPELAGAESRIEIGSHSVFTYDVIMQCGLSISVGERCMFGQATLVVDGNHRFRDLERPMLEQGYDLRPVRLEDDATVTTKCTIIADVGRRAFIGANSVVSRPIPAYTVAVGVPARVIDYFGPPGAEPSELSESNSDRSG
jgi:acetyltransferase-like isoleucine patch superfamily enzyme